MPSTVKKKIILDVYEEGGFLKFQHCLKQHLKKGDRIAFARDALI
jgi:hypothetical protein